MKIAWNCRHREVHEKMIMDDIITAAGRITGIHSELMELEEPFIDFAGRFASLPGTVVLMSGGDLDCARYHILGTKPWLTFSGRDRNMTVVTQGRAFRFEADPFDVLRILLQRFKPAFPGLPAPIAAGLMGYLAYNLKDCLENLPRTSIDDLRLPHILFFAPSVLVIHDRFEGTTRLCIPEREIPDAKAWDKNREIEAFEKMLSGPAWKDSGFRGIGDEFRSNFFRSDYMDAIAQIREYIASGHIYQVNMSQRFEMGFQGDGFSLFRKLYRMNPAPFFAYINAGDHQIVSTSPERFILRNGRYVETRPIKGTRPRGKTPAEDNALKLELEQSKKDDAELSMIVDLLRNDIGKVCRAGSVHVAHHKRLEAYQNVYHLISIVKGELDDVYDSVDLITATFPGGSITGCPKIRSMEIIDELEPNRRHIYTGSIGYISFHDTLDLSIAIRTATVTKDKILFSVGGGIIYDSDPADEYDETIHKGQTLIDSFKGNASKASNISYVWLNGTLKASNRANIPVTDQGLQFGYGFFETIRVDKGRTLHLKAHMERFNCAWEELFSTHPPDLSWNEIISMVIRKNNLTRQTAAVKVLATRGHRETPPFDHSLLVLAGSYTHRLEGKTPPGLKLSVYPEPRQTPLANHKTLNYLYYLLAGKWAKDKGADEALILNPDGTISETNTANILLLNGKSVVQPVSPNVLPGVMEKAVCNLLDDWGYTIERRPVLPEELSSAGQVLITNSLMGAVPVLSVDKKNLGGQSDLWIRINRNILPADTGNVR